MLNPDPFIPGHVTETNRKPLRVCIIGCGVAGLISLRHLNAYPNLFCVTAYEQCSKLGGTWVYTNCTGIDKFGNKVHSSMYRNLRTNLPHQVMGLAEFPFDQSLPSFVEHTKVLKYLESYARYFNLYENIEFNVRVECVKRQNESSGWVDHAGQKLPSIARKLCLDPNLNESCDNVSSRYDSKDAHIKWEQLKITRATEIDKKLKQEKHSYNAKRPKTLWNVLTKNVKTPGLPPMIRQFDIVIVCNGHYSDPFIPDIEGLQIFKGLVMHSHDYRKPTAFAKKDVLVIGAGASGLDIAIDIAPFARNVILSHNRSKPLTCKFPSNCVQKGEVAVFRDKSAVFKDNKEIPVDVVIMCTGYKYNFSFLHPNCELQSDGLTVLPLYKHLFHVKHPSLILMGINKGILPLPFIDHQAQYIVSILRGVTPFPDENGRWQNCQKEYDYRIQKLKWPQHYLHNMDDLQWPYLDGLADEAKFDKIAEVIRKGYEKALMRKQKNLMEYRNENYKIKIKPARLAELTCNPSVDIHNTKTVTV